MEIETHSAFEFTFLTHRGTIKTTCGLNKCLMHQHFVPHGTTFNDQTNGKRHKGFNAHGLTGLISHKMVAGTTEDSVWSR